MKKIIKFTLICFLLVFSLLTFNQNIKAEDNSKVTVYLFYGDGCPHCAKEKEHLKELKQKYGDRLELIYYEVWKNEENEKLMNLLKEKLQVERKGVPFTVIGSNGFIGYNENTGYKMDRVIEEMLNENKEDIVPEIINNPDSNIDISKLDVEDGKFKLPFLGEVDARKVSLPLISIVIGLVDGFNPCAMWVLLFLLSILIGMENKKRAFCLGITFLVASASVYLVFMVAWLNIAISMNSVAIIRSIIGAVALAGAFINLKSFFKKTPEGCSVTDNNKRKKIMEKIKKFTSEKSFMLAMIGIVTLAISVNLIELACSAGLPLLFTQILSFNKLSGLEYGIYIGLYMLFFMIDDIIIFLIAMITMKLTGISNKYTKYSHLVGGIIMLIIGLLLIFKPSILMFNI